MFIISVADEDILELVVAVFRQHLLYSGIGQPPVGFFVKYVTRVLGGEEARPCLEHLLKLPVQVFLSEGGEATLGVHDTEHDHVHGRAQVSEGRRLTKNFVDLVDEIFIGSGERFVVLELKRR